MRKEARALATLERRDIIGCDEGQHLAPAEVAGAFGDLRHRRGHDAEAAKCGRRVGVFQKRFALGQRRKAAEFFDETVIARRKEPLHVARRVAALINRDKAAARTFFDEGVAPRHFQAFGKFARRAGVAKQFR